MSSESPQSESLQKISIGFHAGHVLAARVSPDELSKLRGALRSAGSGWLELQADDGTIVLDLARIDYLLVDHDDHRIGF